VEDAERAFDEPNLIGIVGHPPMKDEIYPMIEVAAARGGLCNLHWHDRLMDRTAQAFPKAQFIVHASTWAAENLAKYDNLWFEIVQYPDGRNSEWDFNWFADKVGRGRLIFGADLPYYDYRYLQGIIDDDLKDAIAQKNTVRLINHYRPDWQMPTDPITAPQQYDPEVLWTCEDDKPDRLTVLS
jgi:predicted TIM-barrel fold metal-dependent hydrolase